MADTMRTLAELEVLLADQTAGAISPQDLRDALLATIQPGHAELSVTVPAATTLADTVTWVMVGGTWALTLASGHWAMTQNGRLYYTGLKPRHVEMSAGVSWTCAGNDKNIQFGIAIDGVVIPSSITERNIATGANAQALSMHAHGLVSLGSYISTVVRNITSGTNITASHANLIVLDFAS